MDSNEISTPASAQPIRVEDINPLINPRSIGGTIEQVGFVLRLLTYLNMSECEVDDRFAAGLALTHRWIEQTLNFACDHAKVEHVVPVADARAGGAS